MTDQSDQTANQTAENLIKQGQEAAQEAERRAQAEEAANFEKEMKSQLRDNAKLLNIQLPPNASIPTMVQMLKDAKAMILNDLTPEEEQAEAERPMSEQEARRALRLENTKLVRVRIACLNPNKAGLPGEIITVHNDVVGTLKKFVPYDELGDQYHIPYMLLKYLKRKKFLQIKDPPKGSRAAPTQKLVPEFSIEVLPQLSQRELSDLAKAQGAAASADND